MLIIGLPLSGNLGGEAILLLRLADVFVAISLFVRPSGVRSSAASTTSSTSLPNRIQSTTSSTFTPRESFFTFDTDEELPSRNNLQIVYRYPVFFTFYLPLPLPLPLPRFFHQLPTSSPLLYKLPTPSPFFF